MIRIATPILLLGVAAWCADSPPQFTAAGITRKIIVPGEGISIYGINLGPERGGCAATADPQAREPINPRNPNPQFTSAAVYPKELCQTQVLIGDKAAGLLFVSDKQINLKIPQDSPEIGDVEIRVVYNGQSSVAVRLPAGFEKTTLSLDQPTYTDMPVWLKVELPALWQNSLQYPFTAGPAGFGCIQVEVRRNGQLLPILPGANWYGGGIAIAGNICGSYGPQHAGGRLPIHLLYRFDQPGVYEVRFTLRNEPVELTGRTQIRAQSEWTPIQILPAKPNQRAQWLDTIRKAAPSDPAELLSNTLPGILGFSDNASLEILLGYLYHPDSSVRRFAEGGLSYWPDDLLARRLLALLQTNGPSDQLVHALVWSKEMRTQHLAEIVRVSLPYLQSDSVILAGGALEAVRETLGTDAAAREALIQAGPHLTQTLKDGNTLQLLAETKDERAHRLLRGLAEKEASEALQPLASFGDPNDLPLIAAHLVQERDFFLSEALYRAYGNAAVPYLRSALSGSPERFMAESLAGALMTAGDPAGFAYALRRVQEKGGLRTAMFQSLRSRFPELTSASDEEVVTFVAAHADGVH
jgi:hypothetical protein